MTLSTAIALPLPPWCSLGRTSTFLSVRKAGLAWIASPISLADCAWCNQTIEQQQQCQGKRKLSCPAASTALVARSASAAATAGLQAVCLMSALLQGVPQKRRGVHSAHIHHSTCLQCRPCARSAPAWTHLSLCLDNVPLLLLKRLIHLSAVQHTRRAFSSARCTAASARHEIRHPRAYAKTSAAHRSLTQRANCKDKLNMPHVHRRDAPPPAHSRCTWHAPPPAAPPAWPPLPPRKPASGTERLCGSECARQSIG